MKLTALGRERPVTAAAASDALAAAAVHTPAPITVALIALPPAIVSDPQPAQSLHTLLFLDGASRLLPLGG
jgi:hypothetical protein